jgi:hypothetical protein
MEILHHILTNILVKLIGKEGNKDQWMRFYLESGDFQDAIQIPYVHISKASSDLILEAIEKRVQSNEEFRIDKTLRMNLIITTLKMDVGGGRNRGGGSPDTRSRDSLISFLNKKRCVVRAPYKTGMGNKIKNIFLRFLSIYFLFFR